MNPRVRAAVGSVLVAALVGACATNPRAAPTSSAPPASAPPPAAATLDVPATPTPVPGEPAATLQAPGLAPIAGTVGSWAIDGRGSDSPWLPARALGAFEVAGDTPIMIAFDDGTPIGAYAARIAAVADLRGEWPRSVGGRSLAAPAQAAVTAGPVPPGAWVLAVQLVRADGRGEATFYWAIRVP